MAIESSIDKVTLDYTFIQTETVDGYDWENDDGHSKIGDNRHEDVDWILG